jgi:hypothetical protein
MRSNYSTNRNVRPRRRFLPQVEGFERLTLLSSVTAYTVSVKDFGAKGDGITDDAPAIQAALDSVPAGGGTVLVPAGDYRLGESLVISHDGTTLTGEGPASILRLMDGVEQTGIILPQAYGGNLDPTLIVHNVTVSRLTLDGNYNPIPASGQPNYFAVFVRQASDVTLSDLVVRHWAVDGISISNGGDPVDQITVENCLITGIHRNGIHVGFATNATIEGNHITDVPSQYWGPAAASGIDVEVEGWNSTQTNPYPGETAPFAYPYVSGLTIEDNIIERDSSPTSGDGIALQPAYGPISNVTISGNLIRAYQVGLQTTGDTTSYDGGPNRAVAGVTFTGNWVSTTGQSTTGYMVFVDGSQDIQVTDNVLHDENHDPVGVYIQDGLRVTLSGNTAVFAINGVTVTGASDTIALANNRYLPGSYNPGGASWLDLGSQVTNFTESGDAQLPAGSDDTTPPAVSFGLADGTVLSSPTGIPVNATDTGSGVARVYFFVDGVPQGYSDTAPYSFAFDPSQYPAGSHELEAMAADNYANLSTSATVQMSVDIPAATGLAVASASGVYGGTTTLTATLTSGGSPVGNEPVVFTLNGTAVGSAVTASNGVATLPGVSLAGITAGTYAGAVAASFTGDANYAGSSGSNSLVVSRESTVTTLASSTISSVLGRTVTFTAAVSAVAPGAGTPTGTITFSDGTRVLAVIPLANGVATLGISSLSVGSHVITAAYSGDADFTGSPSPPVTVSVTKTMKKGPASWISSGIFTASLLDEPQFGSSTVNDPGYVAWDSSAQSIVSSRTEQIPAWQRPWFPRSRRSGKRDQRSRSRLSRISSSSALPDEKAGREARHVPGHLPVGRVLRTLESIRAQPVLHEHGCNAPDRSP